MLECVINVSEGRNAAAIAGLAAAGGDHTLDVHSDPDHHRTVLTLAGPAVEDAARAVATVAVDTLDLSAHAGVHPRIGVLDVVPFAPFGTTGTLEGAITARNRFARWAADALALPCFFYGPERSLPDVRRGAFGKLNPDTGPLHPHPTAGACAVGARPLLVAYNLWLHAPDLALARAIARELRAPAVRTLALQVGDDVQVSCNLVDPSAVGPMTVYDKVAARAAVSRAELVGLVPASVLAATPSDRWAELDLDATKAIEARLESAGLDEGSTSGH
ncbi:MAG TPA: hypothetical protein VNB24_10515 [Acidimicrobiales bacterium]|nr:hypothetical protein [Acidimicrobiales bacterium]